MDPINTDTLFDTLDPDYKDLVFGEFFEMVFAAFIVNAQLTEPLKEELSYFLTLYFVFAINKYELIENVAITLNSHVRLASDLVFTMLENLPPWLTDSIEQTYREGLKDERAFNQFNFYQSLSREELEAYITNKITAATVATPQNLPTETPPQSGSVIQQPARPVLAAEPSTIEKELASIQTVRTMSHDMAAIKPGSDVVYQSSQADILAKNEVPLPPITAAAPDVSRWDTDTRSQ